MYQIRKQFEFSAAHQLKGLPADHPCSRLHGHNYVVEVVLAGRLDEHSFVVDYRELDSFKKFINTNFDHRNLNEVLDGRQTTAENIAYYLFRWCKSRWPETFSVRVSETPKTWAEYFED